MRFLGAEDTGLESPRLRRLKAAITSGKAIEVQAFPRRAGSPEMGVRVYRVAAIVEGTGKSR